MSEWTERVKKGGKPPPPTIGEIWGVRAADTCASVAARWAAGCEDSTGSPCGSGLSILPHIGHRVFWCQNPSQSSPPPYPTASAASRVTLSEIMAGQARALGVTCLVQITHRNPMCDSLQHILGVSSIPH